MDNWVDIGCLPFLVINLEDEDIILGAPWLRYHNPNINWREAQWHLQSEDNSQALHNHNEDTMLVDIDVSESFKEPWSPSDIHKLNVLTQVVLGCTPLEASRPHLCYGCDMALYQEPHLMEIKNDDGSPLVKTGSPLPPMPATPHLPPMDIIPAQVLMYPLFSSPHISGPSPI